LNNNISKTVYDVQSTGCIY